MHRIIRAWRVKIRRSLEKGTKFNIWHVIDCRDPRMLVAHIQRNLQEGMTWENYGEEWQMGAKKDLPVETLEDLYQKHAYKNYVPKWKIDGTPLSYQNIRKLYSTPLPEAQEEATPQ